MEKSRLDMPEQEKTKYRATYKARIALLEIDLQKAKTKLQKRKIFYKILDEVSRHFWFPEWD